MFGDSDGSKDPGNGAPGSNPPEPPFPNRELTLSSYLCDKPPLASAAAGPSSPPNPAPADTNNNNDAANKLCVERDFLHLSAPKRGDPPGDDSSVVGGKKPRLDSLQLSLSLPSDAPHAWTSSQPPPPPSLLPAAPQATDADPRGMHSSRPDRILWEIVSDSVPAMAQVLQDLPSETLEVLREAVRTMINAPEKRDELASLQRKLERRSDLTAEVLGRANKTQLEIMVAIKTGMPVFVTGKGRVSSGELVEMFLMTRCRNVSCKSVLPVDDCKICSTTKGFCGACMCPVCHKFDCAANTCSSVGCDVCGHWYHAACALERNLIRPGLTLKGAMGTTEMQFQCVVCNQHGEMFGFVKEVFNCCAEDWNAETLMKELDYVRKIFAASEDFKGKGHHAKAEEVLNLLANKMISPSDATSSMLQFFKCMEPIELTLRRLQDMTDDFSETRKLGQGAYGKVYRGMYRNGQEVAVKLLHNVGPGHHEESFRNEFVNLQKLNHPHIVKLIGYCYESKYRPMEYNGRTIFAEDTCRALCLEYLHNGSLRNFLSDGICDGRLDWHTRFKIIEGAWKGLKYLHDEPIYHLDLKPDNILLDINMVPKLADFGLSRMIFGGEQTRTTQSCAGTPGYMPPEYIEKNVISKMFDIYSMGVVMIEIISGKNGRSISAEISAQEFINKVHVSWRENLKKKWSGSSLEAYCQQVTGCTEIALKCVEVERHNRPSITDIVLKLTDLGNSC